jgi:guanosine-3',5'-bis(diphosphate) 3'-pyrophosphohydrolase
MTAHLIEAALHVALNAHMGQTDKGGQPYIWHPIRVALSCKTDAERIVALLHDVVEDGGAGTWESLQEAFPPEITEAVDCLTRCKGEPYETFIDRCASNELAAAVKLADLADNMDLSRIPNPSESDLARVEKYRRAVDVLMRSICQ